VVFVIRAVQCCIPKEQNTLFWLEKSIAEHTVLYVETVGHNRKTSIIRTKNFVPLKNFRVKDQRENSAYIFHTEQYTRLQCYIHDHSAIYATTVLYTRPQCYIGDHSAILRVVIALCMG